MLLFRFKVVYLHLFVVNCAVRSLYRDIFLTSFQSIVFRRKMQGFKLLFKIERLLLQITTTVLIVITFLEKEDTVKATGADCRHESYISTVLVRLL